LGGVKSLAAVSHQFLTSIGTNGTPTQAQPAFSDISGSLNLATQVTGNLAVSNLNGGTGASSSTFWRGDGTWVTPAGGGTVTSVATAGMASGGPITGTGTVTVTAAAKTDQQTGTSTTLGVTPSQQQSHDSAAKAWVSFVGSTGAINSSYNVSSVVRNSAGNYTVTFTTAFASANYAAIPQLNATTTTAVFAFISSQSTGGCVIQTSNTSVVAGDPSGNVYLVCFGRQ
jgi:hypothetical protein